MRVVGMDIHRSFAQIAILEHCHMAKETRIDFVHDRIVRFAKTLDADDEVVIGTTGNTAAVERLVRPYVKRVIVAIGSRDRICSSEDRQDRCDRSRQTSCVWLSA